jgi:hypothetical protein
VEKTNRTFVTICNHTKEVKIGWASSSEGRNKNVRSILFLKRQKKGQWHEKKLDVQNFLHS